MRGVAYSPAFKALLMESSRTSTMSSTFQAAYRYGGGVQQRSMGSVPGVCDERRRRWPGNLRTSTRPSRPGTPAPPGLTFDRSRERKSVADDADRLWKYLGRFDLESGELKAGEDESLEGGHTTSRLLRTPFRLQFRDPTAA
jgi:hypothetical protein